MVCGSSQKKFISTDNSALQRVRLLCVGELKSPNRVWQPDVIYDGICVLRNTDLKY